MQQPYDPNITPWQINEQDYPGHGNLIEKAKFLLQYAILAPSKYNIQPWRFSISEQDIKIWLDPSCWLTVSDPTQRELHISIGAALENLLIAAEHFGHRHEVNYFPETDRPDLIASVKLLPNGSPSPFRKAEKLFYAIISRHTSRSVYEALAIPNVDLSQIKNCCVEEEVELCLTDDFELKKKMDDMLVRADALQFINPAFREELKYWMKEGAFDASWLIAKLGRLAAAYLNRDRGQPKADSNVLKQAPFLGILCSMTDNRKAQVKTGQAFERIFLTAASLGVQIQPMTQVIEVPELREELKSLIQFEYQFESCFPQHIFRLGYGSREKSHAPRRSLNEVLL